MSTPYLSFFCNFGLYYTIVFPLILE